MADELTIYQDRIRRVWLDGDWWFSVVDVVGVLTDSPRPGVYWAVLKGRIIAEGLGETLSNCRHLKMLALDRKARLTDAGTEEIIRRIIQFVPRRHPTHLHQGHVYAIQATGGGLVKLGYTTHLERRLVSLQNMCPIPLAYIWHRHGARYDEVTLHAAFASRRQHGEWFDLQDLELGELDRALAVLNAEERVS